MVMLIIVVFFWSNLRGRRWQRCLPSSSSSRAHQN
jgi:hypothetical protein